MLKRLDLLTLMKVEKLVSKLSLGKNNFGGT